MFVGLKTQCNSYFLELWAIVVILNRNKINRMKEAEGGREGGEGEALRAEWRPASTTHAERVSPGLPAGPRRQQTSVLSQVLSGPKFLDREDTNARPRDLLCGWPRGLTRERLRTPILKMNIKGESLSTAASWGHHGKYNPLSALPSSGGGSPAPPRSHRRSTDLRGSQGPMDNAVM